ncbi:MAG: flagellar basal body rod protein FlgB [Oscillospiraceae bacterium]|nr:flagellar basal body rod protein FlgB [Oscillospiraceae bacterium]
MGLFDNGAHILAEQALDATWYKQRVINHNIANVDTPDFKAKTVDFAFILKEEKCKCKYHSALHDTYHSLHSSDDESNDPLKLSVITTYETNTNQILDGNNVDMEKEQLALADAQYQYGALIDYVNNNYAMIRKAISKG